MFKHMLLGLGAASLLVVVTALPVQAAHMTPEQALLFLGDVVPKEVIVKHGGFEWVWANSCGGNQEGCGDVLLHHGFDFPDVDQWNASFPYLNGFDPLNPLNTSQQIDQAQQARLLALISVFTPDKSAVPPICASMYFSLEGNSHCDVNDVSPGGFVWGSPLALSEFHSGNSNAETFLLRVPTPNGSVPEPSSLLLLGAGLLGLAAWRWKHAA